MRSVKPIPAVVDAVLLDDLVQQQTPMTIIDVRTPAEFESVHIPGSYNLPLNLLPERRTEVRDTLRTPAVLVCRSGARAREAEQLLREIDLPQIHVLDGGLTAWEASGKPVKRGRQRWSLERQVRGVAGSLVLAGLIGSMFWRPLALLSAFIGAGLTYSALSDTCGMAMLLSKLPYNQNVSCNMRGVMQQLGDTTMESAGQPAEPMMSMGR